MEIHCLYFNFIFSIWFFHERMLHCCLLASNSYPFSLHGTGAESVQIPFSCQFCLALSAGQCQRETKRLEAGESLFSVLLPMNLSTVVLSCVNTWIHFSGHFFSPYFVTSLITSCQDASSSWLTSILAGVLVHDAVALPSTRRTTTLLWIGIPTLQDPSSKSLRSYNLVLPSFSDSGDKSCLLQLPLWR